MLFFNVYIHLHSFNLNLDDIALGDLNGPLDSLVVVVLGWEPGGADLSHITRPKVQGATMTKDPDVGGIGVTGGSYEEIESSVRFDFE